MKLSKLFLPGLSGIAMYLPVCMLWMKGYRVKAMYPVDLPSNWISLHPGLKKKVIDSMVEHYERLTRDFAAKVLNGERVFLKSLILLPLDVLVAPIAVGYYFIGRYILAKTFVANYRCNNCGICMAQCPTHSILLYHNRPYWKFTCESCMRCMNNCPRRAIETVHSMVFILIFILSVWFNPWLSVEVAGIVNVWFGESWMAYKALHFVFEWSVWLAAFFLGYRLTHFLMRYPAVNRMITYTCLTTWKFWRRYKIPD
jgi:Pyruvate/2-oxoacid:ferredoxin oxidoreductase delta subunit